MNLRVLFSPSGPEWLKPDPVRWQLTTAATLGAMLVTAVMMSFRMPYLAVGPYLVLLGLRRDIISTRIAVIAFAVVAAIASGLISAIACWFWDTPWLRVPAFGLIFYTAYYLIHRSPEPKLISGVLVIVALTTYGFDVAPNPNLIFGQIGWIWALVGTVIAGILLAQSLIPPLSPREQLRRLVRRHLVETEAEVLSRAFGQTPAPAGKRHPADGNLTLLLKTAVLSRNLSRHQARHLKALLDAAGSVADTASALPLDGAPETRAALLHTARRVRQLRHQILRGGNTQTAVEGPAPAPSLSELPTALNHLDTVWNQILAGNLPKPSAPSRSVPRATSNEASRDFALRASLATMFCYIFMTAVHWNGIHTCLVTCAITAIPAAEARRHKQHLRLLGALLGGLAALASAIWIVPLLHDATPFFLLLSAVTWLSAWIANGPERYAYAGLQFILAFYLLLLQSNHPDTDLEAIRDRWFGILFGIVIMRIAFDFNLGLRTARLSPKPDLKPAQT